MAARRRDGRSGAPRALRAGQALEQYRYRRDPGRRHGPPRQPGYQIRGGARAARGREGAGGFRAVQALGLLFPLEPRDGYLGRGDAVREGVRRAVAVRRGRARQRGKDRLARALAVRYRGELAARLRNRRFLLAGAPQARRQGAESRGESGRREPYVGDEVVSNTITTPEVMSTSITTPAAFGRHPSSFEEGKAMLLRSSSPPLLRRGGCKAAG